MKKIFFSIRDYKFDLIAATFAFISYVLAFLFVYDPRSLLVWSIITTVILFVVVVFLRTRDRNFYFVALNNRRDRDDWIGRGPFEYSRVTKSFIVPDTDPGNIYSKCLDWSDYKLEFEFKILSSCLGAIIRAVNLSNYIMFQIRETGIRPHIRVNGGWRTWEHEKVGLTFDEKLSLDKWYKCTFICDKDLIDIKIEYKKAIIFDRSWTIPHDRIAFPFPQKENDLKPPTIHFPVDLDYGSVGFRNANTEKALVKKRSYRKIELWQILTKINQQKCAACFCRN